MSVEYRYEPFRGTGSTETLLSTGQIIRRHIPQKRDIYVLRLSPVRYILRIILCYILRFLLVPGSVILSVSEDQLLKESQVARTHARTHASTSKVRKGPPQPHLGRAAVFRQIDLKREPHGSLIVAVSVHYRRTARGNDEVQCFSLRLTEYEYTQNTTQLCVPRTKCIS